MMNKILTIFFLFTSILFAQEKYTIAVCATSTLENALVCKKRIYDNMRGEVFIVKEQNGYFTNLNVYDDKEIAKVTLKHASKYVLDQKPYIKEINKNIVNQIDKRKLFIDMDETIKPVQKTYKIEKKDNIEETTINNTQDIETTKSINQKSIIPLVSAIPDNLEIIGFLPYSDEEENNKEEKFENQQSNIDINNNEVDYGNMNEESISPEDEDKLLHISMDEFDNQIKNKQEIKISYEKKPIQKNTNEISLDSYEEIIIKVNSKTNIMDIFAKSGNVEKKLKTYIVSTGKNDIKKPLGVGKISQISLNPVWYPTEDTKKSFAKKGIILPNVVPAHHKYNYMGAAKLNLTHEVDGKTTYRIHGTLNEKTLGTNESAGCIRMRNIDVLELAKIIDDFANIKSLNRVKVILI
ncbi:L,D-transpeptidase [Aliarcobacter vitoriensis]|uniref:L,D-transpeptidase n=2 Tax=Aliarcobacter vitoriensis TaxID=2011099 RepID=A0A366MTW4_9BACT|nr:L,D-transpeptidase [Aliarcobacter vitoriensis]